MWGWWLWYGLDSRHAQASGLRHCSSRLLLRLELAHEGIHLERVQRLWPWQRKWPKQISPKLLQILLAQWSHLLSSGVPLLSCITLVYLDKAPARIRYELILLQQALLAGSSFSQALLGNAIFPVSLVQLVEAGEASGELGQLLGKIHQQHARQLALKRRFKRSLFMPLITITSGLLVSLLMIYWVVPQVATLYGAGRYELPALTLWMLVFSEQMKAHLFSIFATLGCIYMGTLWLWSMPKTRLKLETILWSTPGLGRLMYLHSQAEIFLVLSLTFKAGVPLLDCLKLAGKGSSWGNVSKDLSTAVVELVKGRRLSHVLAQMAWQPQVLQLIRVGEAAGDLSLSFSQLQAYYEAEVEQHSQWLEQLLEPILLILVAVFVGGILVALYLPLFQMGQMM